MLKPLTAALKIRDPVYAVIRGIAVNQNGSSNGLTAPSRAAQEQVLREAYARANVAPGQIQYVETQGTGTRLGDAIEALALGSVLGEGRDGRRPLRDRFREDEPRTHGGGLGGCQPDEGRLGAETPSIASQPALPYAEPGYSLRPAPASRRAETRSLARGGTGPRVAGVSAFGFGGSNAHVVLEERPAEKTRMKAEGMVPHPSEVSLAAFGTDGKSPA